MINLWIKELKKIADKKTFFVTFFSVILIHGEMIFNKISFHDDITYAFIPLQRMEVHGRWLFAWILKLINTISASESLPVVNAAVCAVFIALTAGMILDLFCINNVYCRFGMIIIFASIPSVAGHFGYMISAPFDFFGKLLCVFAAYILCKFGNSVGTFIVSSIFLACSLGEYQCYLGFFLCLLLCYLLKDCIENTKSWSSFVRQCVLYLSAAVFGLLIYLAVMKFSLRISGLELTEYAGTNTYGITSLYGYYLRIREAYRDFIIPDTSKEYCMFPFHWNGWHVILIGMLLIFLLICIVRFLVGKEYRKVVFLGIISCLMPAAFQFNMILYGSESMHSLHVYHYSLMFICLAVLSENCGKSICIVKKHLMQQPQKILQKVIIVSAYTMIFVFGALYIRYDNSCYMSNEIRHRAAVSYFTTLITRIQSIDGYDPSIPIAYINSMEKSTEADTLYPQHDLIVTNPYCYPIVNSWNWEKFVVYWCGYSPNVIRYSADEIQQNMEIQKMPQYPSAGSIRMIDGVIVVKF